MIPHSDDINKRILKILSYNPNEIMELALILGGIFILMDFFIDFLILYRNRSLIYVLNVNLAVPSLWNSFMIILCFVLFGNLFIIIRNYEKKKQENVDSYITKTVEALDVLRYNLYSMRITVHSSNNDMTHPREALNKIEEGLSVSINLIDSYLENQNQ